ncbi:hypothetical protein D3C84_213840 [compost metagenome]
MRLRANSSRLLLPRAKVCRKQIQPNANGYKVSNGKQAYICNWLVWGISTGTNSSQPTPMPNTWAPTPASRKRTPPIATLFMAIIDNVTALGNGLKCMATTQKPPVNESISKLRCSAR